MSAQASALLANLTRRGATVSLLDGDRVQVTPSRALTDDDRATIRQHKAALVALLRGDASCEAASLGVQNVQNDHYPSAPGCVLHGQPVRLLVLPREAMLWPPELLALFCSPQARLGGYWSPRLKELSGTSHLLELQVVRGAGLTDEHAQPTGPLVGYPVVRALRYDAAAVTREARPAVERALQDSAPGGWMLWWWRGTDRMAALALPDGPGSEDGAAPCPLPPEHTLIIHPLTGDKEVPV
jgi:hypothetical protein